MAGSSDAYKAYRGQTPNTANYKTDLPETVHQRMMRANEMALKRANARKAAAKGAALPPNSINIRGYFGDERTGVRKPVASFAAKPKQAASSQVKPAAVVRTTVDMKTSPVKTAPIKTAVSPKETSMSRAQRIVAERQAAGPRMAGGKNVSYGFGSAKALGQSIAKSFGGGGQRSGGGMGGGMRSGGGRATDPSRGGMGNSGRGTGSKK